MGMFGGYTSRMISSFPMKEFGVHWIPNIVLSLCMLAGIAAMVAVLIGAMWAYQSYQRFQLEKVYGGSYMIVDGKRIDNLQKILPEIKRTLSLADAMETTSPTLLIDQAEQDLLNNIQDAQERERIRALLTN